LAAGAARGENAVATRLRRLLHVLTRINVGMSPDELYENGLHLRIRRNVPHAYQIGIFGIKGGVGRSTVTVALGSALSRIRGDRILAVDADPDGGNLADRARRQSRATVADLLADKHLLRYNDIRTYANMNGDKLEVLPAAEYGAARRAFDDVDWTNVTDIVSRYCNLILADSGAGPLQPAARGALSTVSAVMIVGLVAAEWISASARPRLRGDQPFDPGQAERRRGGSGGAVPALRSAWTGTGAAVGQARLGGH
jgi:Flp pilus assembly CpaE family ATPase